MPRVLHYETYDYLKKRAERWGGIGERYWSHGNAHCIYGLLGVRWQYDITDGSNPMAMDLWHAGVGTEDNDAVVREWRERTTHDRRSIDRFGGEQPLMPFADYCTALDLVRGPEPDEQPEFPLEEPRQSPAPQPTWPEIKPSFEPPDPWQPEEQPMPAEAAVLLA